jgi:hypothetical protein
MLRVTLPKDGMCRGYSKSFEEDVKGMDAVIVLDNATGTRDSGADADLCGGGCTLNLLSLSSLKTKEVGPVSCTR